MRLHHFRVFCLMVNVVVCFSLKQVKLKGEGSQLKTRFNSHCSMGNFNNNLFAAKHFSTVTV